MNMKIKVPSQLVFPFFVKILQLLSVHMPPCGQDNDQVTDKERPLVLKTSTEHGSKTSRVTSPKPNNSENVNNKSCHPFTSLYPFAKNIFIKQ